MKRWLIPISILLLSGLAALIPIKQNYQLNINSSYYNVYQNLATAQNWAKWYAPFKNNRNVIDNGVKGFKITSPSSNITLVKIGLGAFIINASQGNDLSYFNCFLMANDNMAVTKVMVSSHTKIGQYFWSIITANKKELFIDDLKNYLENTKQYYGFLIKKQVVNEELLIVKRQTSFNNIICKSNRAVLKQLHDFSSEANLPTTGSVLLQYLSSGKDSTEVMVGLGINKKGITNNQVQYMKKPGGKVLVGYFKGKYKDRERLYKAMMLYLTDHYLQPQTKPFEKFEDNQLPNNNESLVNLQVLILYV
jgi:effector-binding domain-containing protein